MESVCLSNHFSMMTYRFPNLLKRLFVVIFFAVLTHPGSAQFMDSQTGLLQMPSGEMQPSGTIMITNNFVNLHSLPENNRWWGYNTFMYGFDITFFSRLEIGYVCVLYRGQDNGFWPKETWGRYTNQDRHFTARVQVIKENEFNRNWIPSLVVGISDPVTSGEMVQGDREGNAFFNRMYVCLTKHFQTTIGEIGAHFGYQYNLRDDYKYNAPCAGITWIPKWLQDSKAIPKLILEFDSRTLNVGFIASLLNNHLEAMFELQNFSWVNFGLRYKFVI